MRIFPEEEIDHNPFYEEMDHTTCFTFAVRSTLRNVLLNLNFINSLDIKETPFYWNQYDTLKITFSHGNRVNGALYKSGMNDFF